MTRLSLATASALIIIAGFASAPLYASDAGAFIGGVFATKIVDNMRRRTRAEEVQAYNSSRAAPVSRSSYQSPEDRLQQLDKLAAGGYISPDEYRAKKQAILDAM